MTCLFLCCREVDGANNDMGEECVDIGKSSFVAAIKPLSPAHKENIVNPKKFPCTHVIGMSFWKPD